MHGSESYLKNLNDIQVMQLILDAELLGKPYLAALKEQLARLNVKEPQ
jgi:hypothetical protein